MIQLTEARLASAVKAHLITVDVFVKKITDYMTSGVPDTYCLAHGINTWLEFKLAKNGESIPYLARCKMPQLMTMREICTRKGRAYYIGYRLLTNDELVVEIWSPLDIDPVPERNSDGKPLQTGYGKGFLILENIVKGRERYAG